MDTGTSLVNLTPGMGYTFMYKNWKGITRQVQMVLESVTYGRNAFHSKEAVWFLNGYDLDREGRRSYVIKDIQGETIRRLSFRPTVEDGPERRFRQGGN